jgi:N-methylhydantoinase A
VVNFDIEHFASVNDVLALIAAFHRRYGERFGAGSQASEAGVRINTVRVSSFVERAKVPLGRIMPPPQRLAVECLGTRDCHFIGVDAPLATRLYDERALGPAAASMGRPSSPPRPPPISSNRAGISMPPNKARRG